MSGEPHPHHERHKRIRLIKRLLRPLPRRTNVHRYPVLKWFAAAARKRAYLWTFRVSAMTPAFYVGSVLALLPIVGIQIPLAFVAALIVRANLPTIVGLQLITNPLTFVPIYVFTRQFGRMVINLFGLHEPISPYGRWTSELVIGGILSGLLLGCALDLVYRFFAYEARKHHWRLPRRGKRAKDSASPGGADEPNP